MNSPVLFQPIRNQKRKPGRLGYAAGGLPLMMAAILTATVTTAATIWNGPQISYSQPAPDPTQAANRDQLTPNVSLTRGSQQSGSSALTEPKGASPQLNPAFSRWLMGYPVEWCEASIRAFRSMPKRQQKHGVPESVDMETP